MLSHEVQQVLRWSVWHSLDGWHLSQHFSRSLPIPLTVQVETLLKGVEERLNKLIQINNSL